nr:MULTISPECIES: LysM peptidoglycan-binding domain-containing protein [Myxococcaceae]
MGASPLSPRTAAAAATPTAAARAPAAPQPTPTPTSATLAAGETLEQLAERTLGDRRAAAELRALNGLAPDAKPAAGQSLRLPGPERGLALGALAAARNALAQTPPEAQKRQEAAAALAEAEAHLQAARYARAAQSADAAWQLVSASASKPTAFTVDVAESGATAVHARSGKPVRVEAEGVVRPVYPGQAATVEKGQPPTLSLQTAQPLAAPQLLQPEHARKLSFPAAAQKGPNGQRAPVLGPVQLAWSEVPGARGYEVEVVPPSGAALRLTVEAPRARLPLLPAGLYRWNVRALGPATPGEASASREFELAPSSLKLEVKGSSWK